MYMQAFGLPQVYVAVSEVKPLEPGQLALVQDQPVRVIDPLREDWWLVATIPEDEGVSPVEGWVPVDKLQPTQGIHLVCICTYIYMCSYKHVIILIEIAGSNTFFNSRSSTFDR